MKISVCWDETPLNIWSDATSHLHSMHCLSFLCIPCEHLWMVVCWNLITLRTNSHGDLTWLQLEGLVFTWLSRHNFSKLLIWKRRFLNFAISLFSPLEKKVGPLISTNLIPHHPRMHCAKFGCNWPSGSGEKDFFKCWKRIFTIS